MPEGFRSRWREQYAYEPLHVYMQKEAERAKQLVQAANMRQYGQPEAPVERPSLRPFGSDQLLQSIQESRARIEQRQALANYQAQLQAEQQAQQQAAEQEEKGGGGGLWGGVKKGVGTVFRALDYARRAGSNVVMAHELDRLGVKIDDNGKLRWTFDPTSFKDQMHFTKADVVPKAVMGVVKNPRDPGSYWNLVTAPLRMAPVTGYGADIVEKVAEDVGIDKNKDVTQRADAVEKAIDTNLPTPLAAGFKFATDPTTYVGVGVVGNIVKGAKATAFGSRFLNTRAGRIIEPILTSPRSPVGAFIEGPGAKNVPLVTAGIVAGAAAQEKLDLPGGEFYMPILGVAGVGGAKAAVTRKNPFGTALAMKAVDDAEGGAKNIDDLISAGRELADEEIDLLEKANTPQGLIAYLKEEEGMSPRAAKTVVDRAFKSGGERGLKVVLDESTDLTEVADTIEDAFKKVPDVAKKEFGTFQKGLTAIVDEVLDIYRRYEAMLSEAPDDAARRAIERERNIELTRFYQERVHNRLPEGWEFKGVPESELWRGGTPAKERELLRRWVDAGDYGDIDKEMAKTLLRESSYVALHGLFEKPTLLPKVLGWYDELVVRGGMSREAFDGMVSAMFGRDGELKQGVLELIENNRGAVRQLLEENADSLPKQPLDRAMKAEELIRQLSVQAGDVAEAATPKAAATAVEQAVEAPAPRPQPGERTTAMLEAARKAEEKQGAEAGAPPAPVRTATGSPVAEPAAEATVPATPAGRKQRAPKAMSDEQARAKLVSNLWNHTRDVGMDRETVRSMSQELPADIVRQAINDPKAYMPLAMWYRIYRVRAGLSPAEFEDLVRKAFQQFGYDHIFAPAYWMTSESAAQLKAVWDTLPDSQKAELGSIADHIAKMMADAEELHKRNTEMLSAAREPTLYMNATEADRAAYKQAQQQAREAEEQLRAEFARRVESIAQRASEPSPAPASEATESPVAEPRRAVEAAAEPQRAAPQQPELAPAAESDARPSGTPSEPLPPKPGEQLSLTRATEPQQGARPSGQPAGPPPPKPGEQLPLSRGAAAGETAPDTGKPKMPAKFKNDKEFYRALMRGDPDAEAYFNELVAWQNQQMREQREQAAFLREWRELNGLDDKSWPSKFKTAEELWKAYENGDPEAVAYFDQMRSRWDEWAKRVDEKAEATRGQRKAERQEQKARWEAEQRKLQPELPLGDKKQQWQPKPGAPARPQVKVRFRELTRRSLTSDVEPLEKNKLDTLYQAAEELEPELLLWAAQSPENARVLHAVYVARRGLGMVGPGLSDVVLTVARQYPDIRAGEMLQIMQTLKELSKQYRKKWQTPLAAHRAGAPQLGEWLGNVAVKLVAAGRERAENLAKQANGVLEEGVDPQAKYWEEVGRITDDALNEIDAAKGGGGAPPTDSGSPPAGGGDEIEPPSKPPVDLLNTGSILGRDRFVGKTISDKIAELRRQAGRAFYRLLHGMDRTEEEWAQLSQVDQILEQKRLQDIHMTSWIESVVDRVRGAMRKAGLEVVEQNEVYMLRVKRLGDKPVGMLEDIVEQTSPEAKAIWVQLTDEEKAAFDILKRANELVDATIDFHGGTRFTSPAIKGEYWGRVALKKIVKDAGGEKELLAAREQRLSRKIGAARNYDRTYDAIAEGIKHGIRYDDPFEALAVLLRARLMHAQDYWFARQVQLVSDGSGKNRPMHLVRLEEHPLLKEMWFKPEVANRIRKALAPAEQGFIEKLFAVWNGVLTPLRATGDLSSTFQQGMRMFLSNPVKATKYWLAVTASIFNAPQQYDRLLTRLDMEGPGIDYLTSHGLRYMSGHLVDEFLFPKWMIQRLQHGPLAIPGKVATASNEHFARLLNVYRIHFANQTYKRLVASGLSGDALDAAMEKELRAINRAFGYSDAKVTPIEAQMTFAVRYTRAGFETVGKAISDWGPEGWAARHHLTMLLAEIGLLTYIINETRGYETEFDPRKPDFMTIRNVNGRNISLLGQYKVLFRFLSQLAMGQPEYSQGPVRDRLRAVERFFWAKQSPAAKFGWELGIKKETYLGKPLDPFDDPAGTLSEFGRTLLPFSVEAGFDEGIGAALVSAFGVNSAPEPPSVRRDWARDRVAQEKFGKKYDELLASQKAQVNQDPEVKKWMDEAAKRRLGLAGATGKVAKIDEDFRQKIGIAAEWLQAGKDQNGKPFTGNDYRKVYNDAVFERMAQLNLLREEGSIPKRKGDNLLQQYYALYEAARLPTGQIDYDKLEQLTAAFEAENPEIVDEIAKSVGERDDPIAAQYRVARQQAREYYNIPAFKGLTLEQSQKASEVLSMANSYVAVGAAPNRKYALQRLVDLGIISAQEANLALVAARNGANPERKKFRVSHPEFARFYSDAPLLDQVGQNFPVASKGGSKKPSFVGGSGFSARARGGGTTSFGSRSPFGSALARSR